jgi:hypothetical protein
LLKIPAPQTTATRWVDRNKRILKSPHAPGSLARSTTTQDPLAKVRKL